MNKSTMQVDVSAPDILSTCWVEVLLVAYTDCYRANICSDFELFKKVRNALKRYNEHTNEDEPTIGEVMMVIAYISNNFKQLYTQHSEYFQNKENIDYIGKYA